MTIVEHLSQCDVLRQIQREWESLSSDLALIAAPFEAEASKTKIGDVEGQEASNEHIYSTEDLGKHTEENCRLLVKHTQAYFGMLHVI